MKLRILAVVVSTAFYFANKLECLKNKLIIYNANEIYQGISVFIEQKC